MIYHHLHGNPREPAQNAGQKAPSIILRPGVLRLAHKLVDGVDLPTTEFLYHAGIAVANGTFNGVNQGVYDGIGHIYFDLV